MLANFELNQPELICVIVNLGLGSKVLKKAKQHNISGGTIFLGKGTVNSKILDYLCLSDVRKEIVLMVSDKETVRTALRKLSEEFKFKKPNHGIAFTTSICGLVGTRTCKCDKMKDERGEENTMYNAITVIVEKGKAEEVIDAATKAGAKGGTIINARGSGIHETSKVFAMEIEPEKEIVLIISKRDKTGDIISSIKEELDIEKPGNGIVFVQNINEVYGLYE
ncbi:P-II family nitrogen regulator [Caproiciproducens sp. MSJ-32]|uniref:P-II family nitrogen regulator n=1 Tax=Caproiciproducens sp. MSJ-32 TaxID=2841527 RepID=UPI001C0F51E7|nr:P-II family nitrogen regulator [Caproiciproducens sp. MSJ-32]MBU5455088.1 P-II family nitrogen regulator [Caproiciproducens sp. MSJ-32]